MLRGSFVWLWMAAAAAAADNVTIKPSQNRMEVAIAGAAFTTVHLDEKWDKPFLHPLRSASGEVVTRGFPVENIAGESNDHTWHRGLWWGHGDINGADFWREKGRDKTGRIVLKDPPAVKANSVILRCELRSEKGKSVGSVRQVFRFSGDGKLRIVDVLVSVRADDEPLKFGDTEEGFLGFRFSDDFREDRGAVLRNSDGLTGTKSIWGKQARWVDYSVTRKGKKLGVAIFDHPTNPRYPTYWHARGYGLNAANPFGLHDFLKDPKQDGSLTIAQGRSVTFRYRVLIHEGADVEALYQAFSQKRR